MVNEIIKEQMIRTLKHNTEDNFYVDDPFKSLMDIYITNDENINVCIPDKYMSDIIDDSVHSKIYGIFDAIRYELPDQPFIEIKIDINFMSHTDVILLINNRIVYRDAMKTWNWTWNSIEDLQEYMFDIYSEIKSNIEKQLTRDEIDILCELANEYRIETCTGCSENCDNPNCTIILQKLGHMITAMEAI